ncbi:precorrin-3B C(17)-methyltransferase [Porphyromonas sp. COT-239 OH1446]|uniref:precorrin-3B C(17)-methyltransferase n=1 Tax=Porphyromonas sp. COT-239 OH1446 TaxID=1515613 RepID=UPI00052D4D72|nr:precorrin-3B C(17)-methyltransferase [Porphyromonas sp. COT-239 OH1446]KGN68083.1 precorrin-3B C17-methyltransferase [Porphyromonas sp. COT-239 OH1446]
MDKHSKNRIIVAGIGPGSEADITPAVMKAIVESDVVVGYKYYFQFITPYLRPETVCIDSGMKKERQRAEEAFRYALEGKTVCVISSGDAGIYGMAPLIYEMKREQGVEDIEIEVLPGISAFQKAASVLGCPIGHDLCIISLSDLMTPWMLIERRIRAAAEADFITAIYNPKSVGRYWQLYRLLEIFAEHRSPDTPVGYVRQAGREEQQVVLTTLEAFDPEEIDMFTVIIIGNTQSYIYEDHFITPRGYYREGRFDKEVNIGQGIMIESFRTIHSELSNPERPLDHKWAMLHAIHTTADFEMEELLYSDPGAIERLHQAIVRREIDTIITDVTMVASGIRKGALERLGLNVKCYLNDPRTSEMASRLGITRSQAGIRLAVEEHPNALFAFGNAPTAVIELCELMRKGKAKPGGMVVAPVGFVNVRESKYMCMPFKDIPKVIIRGRKGGSNLAATLVNSILTLDDAAQLRPGRDV